MQTFHDVDLLVHLPVQDAFPRQTGLQNLFCREYLSIMPASELVHGSERAFADVASYFVCIATVPMHAMLKRFRASDKVSLSVDRPFTTLKNMIEG